MHVHETILSAPVLAAGGAAAFGGVAWGLKKLDYHRVPQVGVLAATFFVVSFIHVPAGPISVHLMLNGLCGLLLGWCAFPAILVGLLLQVPLQHGGFTTLGVNTVITSLPAIVCYYLFGRLVRGARPTAATIAGGACGATAVLLSSLLMAACLIHTDKGFVTTARLAVIAHVPVMGIEAVVTGAVVAFVRRVRPGILEAPQARH